MRTAGSSPALISRYTVMLETRRRLATSATVRNRAVAYCALVSGITPLHPGATVRHGARLLHLVSAGRAGGPGRWRRRPPPARPLAPPATRGRPVPLPSFLPARPRRCVEIPAVLRSPAGAGPSRERYGRRDSGSGTTYAHCYHPPPL